MRTPCVLAKICTITAGRRRPLTPPGLRLAGRAWRRQTPASRAGCGHRSSLPGRHQDRARGPRGPPSTRRAARENSRGRRQGRGEGAVDPPGRAGLRHVPAPLPRAPGPLTAVVRLKAAGPEHRKERSHPAQQPLTGPGARRGLGFGLGLRAKAEAEAADLAGCVLLAQKVGLHRERRHHRHSRSWSTAGLAGGFLSTSHQGSPAQLIYNRSVKAIQWIKNNLSPNGVGTTGHSKAKKKKKEFHLTLTP